MTPIRDIRGELAALREKEIELRAQHAEQLVRLLQVRIPTKPARHSNLKPATHSDAKPAGVPI
jgi:hypothetical protein